jgi:hypothetical protein
MVASFHNTSVFYNFTILEIAGDGLQGPIANLIDDQILTLILVMTCLW